MGKLKDVLYDLEQLHYYNGLNAGRWEQNEYNRLDLMQEWISFLEKLADVYDVGYNAEKINYNDEYEVDEFYFELGQNIKSKLEDILGF